MQESVMIAWVVVALVPAVQLPQMIEALDVDPALVVHPVQTSFAFVTVIVDDSKTVSIG